jgi:outer membrane protein
MTFKKSTLTACLLVCSTHTLAQKGPSDITWSLGVAVISSDQGYVDVGTETKLVPAVGIQYGNFSLLGPQASYKMFGNDQLEISAIGNLRFDGYEAEESDIFKGMEDRDMSFDAGIEAEIDTSFGEFGLGIVHDITSTHKGFELSASYGIPMMFKNGRVMLYVAANYQSEDLANYYYGVQQNEATSSRAFYEVDATTNLEIGIGSTWLFDNKHFIKADISYSAYGSDIKDSPLVDKSGQAQILVGYAYVF